MCRITKNQILYPNKMDRIILLLLTFVSISVLAQQPDLVVQSGHTNLINCAAISNDGKWLATGSIDQSIRVWDIESGKLLKVIQNDDSVYDVAFYGNRYNILSGGYGIGTSALKHWDLVGDSLIEMNFNGGALDIEFSENDKIGAIASSLGYIYLWDVDSNKHIRYYSTGNDNSLKNIIISEQKELVIASSSEMVDSNFVYIWDLNSDKLLHKYYYKGGVNQIHLLKNENALLVEDISYINSAMVYKIDISSGEYLDSFELNNTVLLHDEKHVLGQDASNDIAVIDITTGKTVTRIPTRIKDASVIRLSPDQRKLFVSNKDFEIIDFETGNSSHYIKGGRWIDGLSFSSNASKLAFSGSTGEIINWDLELGDVDIWEGHSSNIQDLYYHKDGEHLASVGYDSLLHVYNKEGAKQFSIAFQNNDFSNITMSVDGNWLAVGAKDSVYSIDMNNGKVVDVLSFWGNKASKVVYSPNEIDFAAILHKYLLVYNMNGDSMRVQYESDGGLEDLAFTQDGKFVATGGYNEKLVVIDVERNEIVYSLPNNGDYVASVAFDPQAFRLAVGYNSGMIRLIDMNSQKIIAEKRSHANIVNKLSFKNDGSILASASWDGKLILWETSRLEKKAELYVFEDGTWAAIDDDGRYDASNAGNVDHLHWVVEGETIGLNQLKERYYEPGLLQKLLGFNNEQLRDVKKLKALELYPQAQLHIEDSKLEIYLAERNGGIGKMSLFINNKEIAQVESSQLQKKEDGVFYTQIDLKQYDKYLKEGENEIAFKANNKENYLSSPKVKTKYFKAVKSGFAKLRSPILHGIIIGTADYRGEKLDLQFADKDAERFYDALNQTGKALFGDRNTSLYLLNTNEANTIASKDNIRNQFKEIAEKAMPEDAFVVYLSGHGVNFHSDNEDQFYYLTKDIESGNLSDSEIRNNYAISTAELTNWINTIPAEKQVLIIDACASGQVIEDIMVGTKAVSSSQIRAMERMKDRTGMFVLAGSASNQVSYEASQFGQSLLTYSLLAGMKGQALRENEFVDIAKLFDYSTDQVPELAAYIGGIQKPIIAVPYGGNSFDIGKVDESIHIDLPSIKPIFIRSNFQDEFDFADVLGISNALDSELRDYATKGSSSELIFVDVSKYPEAYSIKGRYQVNDEVVEVTGRLFKDRETIGSFEIKGSKSDLSSLIDQIMEKANELISE